MTKPDGALDATLEAPPEDRDLELGDVPAADLRRYRIVAEVGRGGLGRVLAAEDRLLRRKIAIKELRTAHRGQARFLREALITARLQHPSIVPLYELGTWDGGEPFYAMRLVSGRSLAELVEAATSLDDRLALLPNMIAVADAIAYAHSEHIIHRDLKPSNVLIGAFGETVVIDWGLAKHLDETDAPDDVDAGPYRSYEEPEPLTLDGEVLGTPVYMAPEQALGEALDARADVYAIGAMLYELLTGEWPHAGASSAQVIARLICGDPIAPIAERQPGVPADLAAIVTKAMSFDRAERYADAGALAVDLRRFQTGQLVAAHRYTRRTLVRRWLQRHRALAIVSSVMFAAVVTTATIGVVRVLEERDRTRAERDRLVLAQAAGALERDPTATIAWLERYHGDDAARAHELALSARARGVARFVLARMAHAQIGQFSPDGLRFAQPGTPLRVIELGTGATSTHPPATAVSWADGQHLAAISTATHDAAVLDTASGAAVHLAGKLRADWAGQLFSRDGTRLLARTLADGLVAYDAASGDATPMWTPFPVTTYERRGDLLASQGDGVIVWWRAGERTGHPLAAPGGDVPAGQPYAIADDDRITAVTRDGKLVVWTLADGGVRVFSDAVPIVQQIDSDDGTTHLTFDGDGRLRVWDLASGASRALPRIGALNDVAVTRDGRFAAVASDRRVAVIDTRSGELTVVGMHPGTVERVAIAPDGTWVASDGDDGSTRLWQVHLAHPDRLGTSRISAVAVSGGASMAAGERVVLSTPAGDRELVGHTAPAWAAAFSADGLLATGGGDHAVRLWDAGTGRPAGEPLDAGFGRVTDLAFARGELIVSHQAGQLVSWSLATRRPRRLADVAGPGLIGVGSGVVAVGDAAGVLHLVPIDGGAPRELPGAGGPLFVVRVTADSRYAAGGTYDGRVVVWDLATGAVREVARHEGPVAALALSRDGRYLASSGNDVALVDLASGTPRRLAGHVGDVAAVAFVDDGLVTGGADATVRWWSLDGELRSVIATEAAIATLAASGDRVVAGTLNGVAYRWSPADFAGALPPLAELTDAIIDEHERLAVSSRRTDP